MEALASVEDLETFLEHEVEDRAGARLKLELASGEVRAFCGQEFTPRTDDELVLDGSGTAVLLLPELPVLDVSLLELGPGGAREELTEGSDFEWSENGILRTLRGVWPRRFRYVRAVYSHGWEPIPDAVLSVVLGVAARSLEDPGGGFRSETIGRYSYTKAGADAGVGLFAPDRLTLERGGFVIGSAPRVRSSSAAGSGSGS